MINIAKLKYSLSLFLFFHHFFSSCFSVISPTPLWHTEQKSVPNPTHILKFTATHIHIQTQWISHTHMHTRTHRNTGCANGYPRCSITSLSRDPELQVMQKAKPNGPKQNQPSAQQSHGNNMTSEHDLPRQKNVLKYSVFWHSTSFSTVRLEHFLHLIYIWSSECTNHIVSVLMFYCDAIWT